MQRKWRLLVVLVMWSFAMSAQRVEQYVRAAEAARQDGEWTEAFGYYEAAFAMDSSSFEILSGYALSAKEIRYYSLAENLYKKSYAKDNGNLEPDELYWLAMMQKYNGHYEDAQRNFQSYIKKFKSKGTKELVNRAEQELKSALWAMNYKGDDDQKDHVKNATFELKYDPLKDVATENSGSVQPGSSRRFAASPDANGKWQMLVKENDQVSMLNYNFEIDGKKVESISSLSFGENGVVYFTATAGLDVYICSAQIKENELQDASPIMEVYQEFSVQTMPCEGKFGNDKALYFASDRSGGQGGMDIWISTFEKGKWSKPKNAGKNINSPGEELSPFFFNGSLYFSSDWHEGFGGLDVFESVVSGSSIAKPKNIGQRFNSSANDFYFFKKSKGEGYLSSNRERDKKDDSFSSCCNGLYHWKWSDEEVIDKKDDVSTTTSATSLRELMSTLPVRLYFHNDEPNPDSWDTTTTLAYHEAYDSYMKLLPVYIKENSKGLAGNDLEEAETITNDFFTLRVTKGKSDLDSFAELLLKELQSGKSLRVDVRGFASPRAQSDYNLNLTKRRTASLVNEMRVYQNGEFLPYLDGTSENGARLSFQLLPFGEVKADKGVSDDLTNERKSIFNRSACLERKIEIENVTEVPTEQPIQKLSISEMVHDFGKINIRNGRLEHTFELKNVGTTALVIDSVVPACGCTEPTLEKSTLQPGETTKLVVGFNPFGPKGPLSKDIMIYPMGEPAQRLELKGVIE